MQDEIRTLPQKLLMGRRALVTGAGRGIGREIARQMALEGADVIINARKEPELLTLREEITAMGQKCQIVLGDICTPETAEKFAAAAEEWGGLDILVNNAGILDRDGTLQTTPETFDHIIQVNLVSVFRITQKLLQALCESKGCIVNITSSASRAPHPNANPAYGASKAGLTALTRQWALEFAPQGVRINAVQCGPIETDMSQSWTPEYREKVMSAVPLHRLGTPWDVARCAVFLASEQAAYITGASLNANGKIDGVKQKFTETGPRLRPGAFCIEDKNDTQGTKSIKGSILKQ